MADTCKVITIEENGTVVESVIKKGEQNFLESTNPTEEWLSEDKAVYQRTKRGHILSSTDWTQTPDVPDTTQTKWREYRQTLRELPAHKNWPYLEDADWPTKPS